MITIVRPSIFWLTIQNFLLQHLFKDLAKIVLASIAQPAAIFSQEFWSAALPNLQCHGMSYHLVWWLWLISSQIQLAESQDLNHYGHETGVSPGEGTGATMSDDDDEEQADSDTNMFDGSLDGSDMGFGPLIPTETERSLMERVRQELKHELKQVGLSG